MSFLSRSAIGTFLVVSVVFPADEVFADVGNLLDRVPGDANVIVVIDVQRVMKCPMAHREGWAEKRAATRAMPVVGRERRQVNQLACSQVHYHRQNQGPQMRELRFGNFLPHRRKETLHKRRQPADNHGSALHGKGCLDTNQPKRAVFHAPTAKMAETAQFE